MSRDDTFKGSVECVDSQTTEAFAKHELTERRPWVWKVMRPNGEWTYGFYVLVAPGAVIVYGDVGEAVFRMNASTEEEVLDWLRRSVQDRHYLISKIQNREAFRRFYSGDAIEYAKKTESNSEQNKAMFGEDVSQCAEYGELTASEFYRIAGEHQVYDIPSCEEWSASAFWMAAVLACFIRLHDKRSADGNDQQSAAARVFGT